MEAVNRKEYYNNLFSSKAEKIIRQINVQIQIFMHSIMLICREDNILVKERSIIYIYGSGSVSWKR